MMKKKQNRYERVIVVAILTLLFFFIGHDVCLGQKVVLRGRVIAFENSLLRITKLADIPREETFFVKVEKVLKGKEASEFIKVNYRYFEEKTALPESLFERNKHWKFVLLRNRQCDQTGVTDNPSVVLVKIDESGDGLPKDANFPCYLLTKVKLKAIK